MNSKYFKLLIAISWILCTALGIWIGMSVKTIKLQEEYSSQTPRRIVSITINDGQQEEFFRRLRTFSEEQAYAILISPTALDPEKFIIQMWREDINMIGANSYEPGKFQFGFYDTDRLYPATEAELDNSVRELKAVIEEIPGAIATEEK